jgi:histone H3/H4
MAKKAAKSVVKEPLVVGSKVRAYIRGKNAMMSGELLDALNCVVGCILEKAVERAQANKRSTVRPQDL